MSQPPRAPRAAPDQFYLILDRGQAANIMADLPLGHSVHQETRDLYLKLREEVRKPEPSPQGEPMPAISTGQCDEDDVMYAPPQEVRPSPARLPRRGVVIRTLDVTGVSGLGHIAEVCEFSDGKGVIRWLGGPPQDQPKLEFYDNPGLDPFLQISGHNGNTKIVWLDEPEDHSTLS